jgi:hypothetical protein
LCSVLVIDMLQAICAANLPSRNGPCQQRAAFRL